MRRRLALAAEAAIAALINHLESENALWPDELKALQSALEIVRKYTS